MRGGRPMAAALLVALLCAGCDDAPTPAPLTLAQTIPLPGVEGRIDHLALDPSGKHLALAALGNDTVEVIDLAQKKVVRTLRGIEEPQGVVYLADGRLVVTSGSDGTVRYFDAGTYEEFGRVDVGGDADNVRLEAGTGRLVVGHDRGALAILAEGKVVADLKLDGHPESFQLEAKGSRVFANVPGARHVAVVDRASGKRMATWRLETARSNFPMALDEEHGRLFVGCRTPSRLLVLDTKDGSMTTSVEITVDVDDIWLDGQGRRAYVSCGGGAIDVLEQGKDATWLRVARVETAAGARTSLYDPGTHRLYLAVPHRGAQPAEVRIYETTEAEKTKQE